MEDIKNETNYWNPDGTMYDENLEVNFDYL
jgi:hypothetical protein